MIETESYLISTYGVGTFILYETKANQPLKTAKIFILLVVMGYNRVQKKNSPPVAWTEYLTTKYYHNV